MKQEGPASAGKCKMTHRKPNPGVPATDLASPISTSDFVGKPLHLTDGLVIPYGEFKWKLPHTSGDLRREGASPDARADLIFDPGASSAFDKAARDMLLKRLGPRLNAHGELHIIASEKTSQHENRETALLRLQEMLREALQTEHKGSKNKGRKPVQGKRLYDKHQEAVKNADRRTESAPIEELDLAPRPR